MLLNQLSTVRSDMIRGLPDLNYGELLEGLHPTVDIKAIPEQDLDSAITFTRATTGYRRNPVGKLESMAIDQERHDYDPSTGLYKGLLIEEDSTNLCLQSETIGNASWTKNEVTITDNDTTAPDGATTADKMLETVTDAGHWVEMDSHTITIGQYYTFSVFVKSIGDRGCAISMGATRIYANFNLETGEVNNIVVNSSNYELEDASIEAYPDDWYRISITGKALSVDGSYVRVHSNETQEYSGSINTTFAGDTAKGLYIWGAQIEEYSKPTSYIATTTSQVTRAKDIFELGNGALSYDWASDLEGTIFFECEFLQRDLTEYAVAAYDDSANYISIRTKSDNTGVAYRFRSGGVNQFDENITVDLDTLNKYAFSWALGDHRMSLNGVTQYESSDSSAIPVGWKMVAGAIAGASEMCGWFKRITIFSKALTEDQINLITE